MYERHPSADDLAGLLAPDQAPAHTRVVVGHLFRCEDCWHKAADTLAELEAATRVTGSAPAMGTRVNQAPELRALVERYRLEQTRLEERLVVRAAIGSLRGMQRRLRREHVTRIKAYHNRSAVEELLAEARASNAPLEGEEWAGLALLACHQLPPGEFSEALRADLLAEGCAELASARRRSARWNAAREALKQGQDHAKRGSGNPSIQGLLLAVEGAIEGDIGALDGAEATLRKAKGYFEAAGESRLAARTVVQIAYVLMDAEPARSLDYLQLAATMIPSHDKRLFLYSEATRIDCLITLGNCREAMRRFESLTELWDQFADPFIQLRRRFMAGRLLEGLGRYAEADALFREVIAVDLEQRSTKSLFLDLIYLFGSYAKRGDLQRALEVCQQAIRELSVLELDTNAQEQMHSLWTNLARHAQKGAVGLTLLSKSRHFIRTEWRTAGGDPLATKESAI